MVKNDFVRLNVYLDTELYKFLKEISTRGAPMTEHVRRALEDYRKKWPRKRKSK